MEDAGVEIFDLRSWAQAHWPSPLTITLGVAVLVLAILARPSRAQRAIATLPRPPSSLPLLGNTIDAALTHRHTLHTWLLRECLRFEGRPFAIDMLTKAPTVVLSTVAAVEDVLKTQFDAFGKGDEFREALLDLFGTGIFTTDGAKWHAQRKTASNLFSMQRLKDVMDAVMASHTEQLCGIVAKAGHGNANGNGDGVLDVKHLMELYATDVFTKIGFGVDLDFMTQDNHEFFARFGRANHNMLHRQQTPTLVWKLQHLLGVGPERQQKADVAWLDKFIYQIIQDSIARKHAADTTVSSKLMDATPPHRDLITLLLDSAEQADGEYNVREIRDMAMAFISAGRDTTAYSMAWFMVMVARYPQLQKRIRAEIWAKVPRLRESETAAPTKDETADLVVLEAAIKENLRLNPVIPLNMRESLTDVTLCDGTFLATGTKVLLPVYAMARMLSVWGPDAADFNVDRWIDADTGKLRTVSPYQFVTFSAGPRVCIGRQFSMIEMKTALAALLSKFEIETVADPWSFTYDASLTLGVDGPILIRPKRVVVPAASQD